MSLQPSNSPFSQLKLLLAMAFPAMLSLLPINSAHAVVIEISPAVTSGDVDEFKISPDGTMIAFVGTLEGGGTDQAYVVPIGGGTATLLNPDGVGDVDGGVAWTPDSTGVVVRYGGGTGNVDNQMYLLPASGSQIAQQLTFNNTNVFDPQVSADGQTLYYIDSEDTTPEDPEGGADGDDLLYATSIADAANAPAPVLITPDETAELDTGGYAQSGSEIVYAGSLPGEGETLFYRTAADGSGTPTPVAVSNIGAADIDEMVVTPDGQSIIFVADITTDGVDELYSLPIAGGEAVRLLPEMPDFADVGPMVVSPDGSLIAFQADYEADGVGAAFVVPVEGGVPYRVSDDLTMLDYNADVVAGVGRMEFTPDGKSLVYLADGRANGVNEMFIVPVSNPIPEPGTIILALLGGSMALVARFK